MPAFALSPALNETIAELAAGPVFDTASPCVLTGPIHERLNPLDGGEPNRRARNMLAALDYDSLCVPHRLGNASAARACIAGLWLRHNFLEDAHVISQALEDADGSFWHAIMHRREPDAANAAYWFRRVGAHPIDADLRAAAANLAETTPCDSRAGFLVTQPQWNALAFIDLCEIYRGTQSSTELLCQRVQLCEWNLLFAHCWRKAISKA